MTPSSTGGGGGAGGAAGYAKPRSAFGNSPNQPGRTYRDRRRRRRRWRWRLLFLNRWSPLGLHDFHIIGYGTIRDMFNITQTTGSRDVPGNNPIFAPPCPTPLHHPSSTSSICSITSPSTRLISLSSVACRRKVSIGLQR